MLTNAYTLNQMPNICRLMSSFVVNADAVPKKYKRVSQILRIALNAQLPKRQWLKNNISVPIYSGKYEDLGCKSKTICPSNAFNIM